VRKSSGKLSQQDVRDYFLATSLDEGPAPNSDGTREECGNTLVSRERSVWNPAVQRVKGEVHYIFTYSWWKGILEWLLALVTILILSPLLLTIAIMIRFDSPGNPIFCQERVGKDGRRFILYKFRSMYKNQDDSKFKAWLRRYVLDNASSPLDENGQDIHELVHDPRVTRFGSLLRKTSLDELPQLINVLKGDMAFIGPRPDIPFMVEMYDEQARNKFRVKPGITGLWQVASRRSLSFKDMVRLDLEYIERQSLFLDAKIVLFTIREILTRDGRWK